MIEQKAKLFISELKKVYDEKGEDEALFFLCGKLYDMLDTNKETELVNTILEIVDVEYYSETVLVGFLVYTNNYISMMPFIKGLEGRNVKLSNRPELINRMRLKFERDNVEDIEDIFKGLVD